MLHCLIAFSAPFCGASHLILGRTCASLPRCKMFNVQCAVCNVHLAVRNMQCAVCSVQYAMCSVPCRVAKCARREHGNTWRLPPSFKLISLQMLNVATSHLPPCNASQFLGNSKTAQREGGRHIRPKLS